MDFQKQIKMATESKETHKIIAATYEPKKEMFCVPKDWNVDDIVIKWGVLYYKGEEVEGNCPVHVFEDIEKIPLEIEDTDDYDDYFDCLCEEPNKEESEGNDDLPPLEATSYDTIVCWGAGDGTVDLVSFLIDDNKFSEDEDKAHNYMGEKYDDWGTFITLRDCRSTPIDVKELDDEGNDDLPPLEATSYDNISKWFDEEEFDSDMGFNELLDYAEKQFECSFLPFGEPSLERTDKQNRHDWLYIKWSTFQNE